MRFDQFTKDFNLQKACTEVWYTIARFIGSLLCVQLRGSCADGRMDGWIGTKKILGFCLDLDRKIEISLFVLPKLVTSLLY